LRAIPVNVALCEFLHAERVDFSAAGRADVRVIRGSATGVTGPNAMANRTAAVSDADR
jgi:hypothetical protein